MLLPSNIVSKVLRKNHRILVNEAKFSHESKAWKASQRIYLQTHPPPALSVPLSPSGLSASASTSAWRFSFQKCPRMRWSRILGIFMQLATVLNDHRVGCLPPWYDWCCQYPNFHWPMKKHPRGSGFVPASCYQFWERKVFKLSQNNSHVYRTSVSHEKNMDMFTPRYSGTYAHRTLGDPDLKTGTHPYHFQVGG